MPARLKNKRRQRQRQQQHLTSDEINALEGMHMLHMGFNPKREREIMEKGKYKWRPIAIFIMHIAAIEGVSSILQDGFLRTVMDHYILDTDHPKLQTLRSNPKYFRRQILSTMSHNKNFFRKKKSGYGLWSIRNTNA